MRPTPKSRPTANDRRAADYGDLTTPLTRVAEQNVASLCLQGLDANATNRHCRPQGKRAGESRFPYVCSVRKAGTRKHFCSASLVNRRWLLTTAHCVDPNSDASAGCYPLVYCSSPIVNDVDEEQASRFPLNPTSHGWMRMFRFSTSSMRICTRTGSATLPTGPTSPC